jgi:hypothetical protein
VDDDDFVVIQKFDNSLFPNIWYSKKKIIDFLNEFKFKIVLDRIHPELSVYKHESINEKTYNFRTLIFKRD